MKLRTLSALALTSSLLSSCVYYTHPIPEMPYSPYRAVPSIAPADEQALYAAGMTEGTWQTTPPADPYATPAPVPAPVPVAPAAVPPPTNPGAITQQPLKLAPVTPAPAVTPKPATPAAPVLKPAAPALKPAAAPPSTQGKDPKTITNNGPIPVATPVPGDPTRVYNPLDSTKTIRITDKNGKVYPSGKELKVRGTNFHFYVP